MPVSAVEDAAIERLRKELERTLDRQEKELRRLAAVVKRGGTKKATLAAALAIGDKLADALEGMGSTATKAFRRTVGAVVAEVGAELADIGIPPALSEVGETTLQAQLGTAIDDIAERTGRGARTALREVITEQLRGTVDPADAIEAVRRQLGQTVAQVLTVVDTATMGVDRTIVLAQASDSGFEWFGYDGPSDSLTRPWCAEHIGKRYRDTQIAAMDNGTDLSAAAFGGGHNCRHRWVILDPSELKDWPIGTA